MVGDHRFGGKTVIEEPDVLKTIEFYHKTVPGFDEAYDALTWYLSHDGEGIRGACLTMDKVTYYEYVQAPNKMRGTPRLGVIYTSDDYKVTIVAVRIVRRKRD